MTPNLCGTTATGISTRRVPSHIGGGVPVTDELIDRLAGEAEEAYDVPTLRRRGGRPPRGSTRANVVPVRLEPELRAALVARAESDHTHASEVIKQALRAWLDVA